MFELKISFTSYRSEKLYMKTNVILLLTAVCNGTALTNKRKSNQPRLMSTTVQGVIITLE